MSCNKNTLYTMAKTLYNIFELWQLVTYSISGVLGAYIT